MNRFHLGHPAWVVALSWCLAGGWTRGVAQESVLFEAGDLGYACFRIPAIVDWDPGELLAFAEGRKSGCADFGDVDILMRRSTDGGATWSPALVVADHGNLQAGNPTPILDRLDPDYPEGRLFLCFNTGTASEYDTRMGLGVRRGWYITSTDHGSTWSDPTEIDMEVYPEQTIDGLGGQSDMAQRTLAFAPGHGLQLGQGPHRGRLLIPANHSLGPPQDEFRDYRTFAVLSDDHGRTWRASEDLDIPSSNEAMAVELPDGDVLLTVRMQNSRDRRKRLVISKDGGAHWDSTWLAASLTTPMCQSSILQFGTTGMTLHLGPADTLTRTHLTLWSSRNAGRTWSIADTLWPGSAAYSDLAPAGEDQLGILYERAEYREIAFTRWTMR